MSVDIIVLVKYVADVEHIPPDAWDLEQGTLRRRRIPMVANPLDDRALAAGRAMARDLGGSVTTLSMGPASAERALRRALAYGADRAVLLSDRAFAGADTLATARSLARAVARLVREGGLRDPLILAGLQSPDGDTAQVPAGLAALLDIPLVPYATGWSMPGPVVEHMERRGRSHRLLAGGSAVITWTGQAEALPFATDLRGMRRGAAARVEHWTAEDLQLSAEESGLRGSATQVKRIISVPPRSADGPRLSLRDDPAPEERLAELAEWIGEECAASASFESGGPAPAAEVRTAAAGTPRREGPEIWVWMEVSAADAQLLESNAGASSPDSRGASALERAVEGGSLELLGAARELADHLGVHATAVFTDVGLHPEHIRELGRYGASRVLELRRDADTGGAHEAGASHSAGATQGADVGRDMPHHDQAALLAGAVRERHPRTLLLPASLQGRTVAALTAAQLETGLTADCTSLELDEESGGLLQIRPALGGNIRATIITRAAGPGRPEMATVRSGVFPLRRYPESAPQHESCVVPGRGHKLEGGPAGLRPATVRLQEEAGAGSAGTGSAAAGTADGAVTGEDGGVDTAADVVLAVGRGIGSAERLQAFVQPLMEVLQSRLHLRVSLACSRAVVEAGILPYEYQIGQTGKSVRPALYIAVGISGAIQHRLGMEHSSRIVSINPDAEAPIHALSDYAVVATVEEALPGLTEALRSPSAP